MVRAPEHHAVVTLDWDETSKRWKLTWTVSVGRGKAHHWLWVESRAAVDPAMMRDIAHDVRQRIEAALF